MTGDEVERAIGFLLESQATIAAKVDANTDAIAALTSKVDGLVGTVDALVGTVDGLAGVANTALDVATKTAAAVTAFAEAQTRANAQTNEHLARLATMIERHVITGH